MSPIRSLFLTFDVEDFINDRSTKSLRYILKLLEKHELKGLFFITGHMAEKLARYKEILDLLSEHQLGYHSSSHSVRPTILEYTDAEDYDEARLESVKRETAHINPLTGEVEGRGGIFVLRDLFPNNQIEAFRAPDYCWSPPHLEALKDLGIKYDFSTKLSSEPVEYKGITFYPYPICHDWSGKLLYMRFSRSVIRNRIVVLNFHHWYFVNCKAWNWYYVKGNPEKLWPVEQLPPNLSQKRFSMFESLLKKIRALKKIRSFEVIPKMEKSLTNLKLDVTSAERICKEIGSWFRRYYGYQPKYLCDHFRKYFQLRT
jgi:peptidoglycan/xylan/chitin deacetylase (PgdA/CDA1 family)